VANSKRMFDTVSAFNKLDRDLLEARQTGIFKNVKQDDETLNASTTASENYEALHQAHLIHMLLELHKIIFAVIPAATCTAERSFNCLQRTKTYLRNTMDQDRLNSVALTLNIVMSARLLKMTLIVS